MLTRQLPVAQGQRLSRLPALCRCVLGPPPWHGTRLGVAEWWWSPSLPGFVGNQAQTPGSLEEEEERPLIWVMARAGGAVAMGQERGCLKQWEVTGCGREPQRLMVSLGITLAARGGPPRELSDAPLAALKETP